MNVANVTHRLAATIKNKAGTNLHDKEERTPLHFAAEEGHANVVRMLIESEADINAQDYNGWTPLMTAVEHGHIDVVETLLKFKADKNLQTNDGESALDNNKFVGVPR